MMSSKTMSGFFFILMKLGTVSSAFFFFSFLFFFPPLGFVLFLGGLNQSFLLSYLPRFLSVLSPCHGMLDVLITGKYGEGGLAGIVVK